MSTIEIRAIIFKEGDVWVGQCLEYDIGAQAADLDTLDARLRAVTFAECEAGFDATGKPFGGIPKAPDFFWRLWDETGSRLTPARGNLFEKAGSRVNVEMAIAA